MTELISKLLKKQTNKQTKKTKTETNITIKSTEKEVSFEWSQHMILFSDLRIAQHYSVNLV